MRNSKAESRFEFLIDIGKNRWVRLLVLLLILSGILVLLKTLAPILRLLIYSLVLAYLFDPIVDRLERFRLPRGAAVIVLIALMMIGLSLVALILIPSLSRNFDDFVGKAPDYGEKLTLWAQPFLARVLDGRVPTSAEEWMAHLGRHQGFIEKIARAAYTPVLRTIQQTLTGVTGLINALLSLIVVPVAWFYLLRDIDLMKNRFLNLVPPRHRNAVVNYATEIDAVISNFMRGQLTVCVVLGFIYAIGLQLIAGVPLGVLIGLLAGFASIVPYLGLILGIIPALLLAALEHGDFLHPFLVVLVFAGAQALEGTVITPKIVGDKLGLHPVAIIFAIMIWGALLGFVGMIIAVPLTAVLRVFGRKALARYLAGDFYRFGNINAGG